MNPAWTSTNSALQTVQLVASLTLDQAVYARRAAAVPRQTGTQNSEFATTTFIVDPGYDAAAPVRPR